MYESFLGRVGGVCRTAQHSYRQRVDACVLALDQGDQRVALAGLGAPHELGLVVESS